MIHANSEENALGYSSLYIEAGSSLNVVKQEKHDFSNKNVIFFCCFWKYKASGVRGFN